MTIVEFLLIVVPHIERQNGEPAYKSNNQSNQESKDQDQQDKR